MAGFLCAFCLFTFEGEIVELARLLPLLGALLLEAISIRRTFEVASLTVV